MPKLLVTSSAQLLAWRRSPSERMARINVTCMHELCGNEALSAAVAAATPVVVLCESGCVQRFLYSFVSFCLTNCLL